MNKKKTKTRVLFKPEAIFARRSDADAEAARLFRLYRPTFQIATSNPTLQMMLNDAFGAEREITIDNEHGGVTTKVQNAAIGSHGLTTFDLGITSFYSITRPDLMRSKTRAGRTKRARTRTK